MGRRLGEGEREFEEWVRGGNPVPARSGVSVVLDGRGDEKPEAVQGVEVVGELGRLAGSGVPGGGGRPFSKERHIVPLPAQGLFAVECSGFVLKVLGRGPFRGFDWVGGVKQEMGGWSKKSRLSCYQTFCAVEWPEELVFISLTWPGDLGKSPKSGPEARGRVTAFLKRWERAYGKPVGAWKREFQVRGSIHYHVWLKKPEGASSDELRAFVGKGWNELVAPGDEDHLYYGGKVESWEGNPGRYLLKEMGVAGSKAYQNQVPDWFEKPGRFWGLLGGLRPEWRRVEVTPGRAMQVRRSVKGLLGSRGYRVKFRGGWSGVCVVVRSRDTLGKLLGAEAEKRLVERS